MQYTSKQQQIHRSAEQIYTILSKFSNFTPILQDKVEQWTATDDRCSFKAKGMTIGLKMDELTPHTTIKIVGDDNGAPFPFSFWVQLKESAPYDTRLRIVLDVELNMMMKMMIGGKLQDVVDKIAEQIATGLNAIA